jgi:hypothetical protein
MSQHSPAVRKAEPVAPRFCTYDQRKRIDSARIFVGETLVFVLKLAGTMAGRNITEIGQLSHAEAESLIEELRSGK